MMQQQKNTIPGFFNPVTSGFFKHGHYEVVRGLKLDDRFTYQRMTVFDEGGNAVAEHIMPGACKSRSYARIAECVYQGVMTGPDFPVNL